MKTTAPTAYSYLRFSSAQRATGDSIRRQTEASAAWCKRNNVTLDATMKDEGVSAYKGRHRAAESADTHALARFLAAVEKGRVAKGSYLIIESMDRLTREDIIPAVNLFTGILMRGIRIVQLHPSEHVYTDKDDMTAVMLALVELSRGNSESKMKAERVGRAWANKLRNAGTKVVTRRVPGWIDVTDGKCVLNAERAAVVRRIFRMAIDGDGALAIAKRLNADGNRTMGRATVKGRAVKWDAPTVRHILTSRATVGEYIPYKSNRTKASGEPVAGYYPPVIDEATYYAAQAAMKTRSRVGRGRKGRHVNLLAGLLTDARTGGSMTYCHNARGCSLIPVGVVHGSQAKWVSYPAAPLEMALLGKMKELTAADVTDDDTDAAKRLKDADAKVAKCDTLIAAWTAKMDDVRIIDTVAAKLAELAGERAAAVEEREAARRDMARPAADALGDIHTLADVLRTGNSDDTRTKVRAGLRAVVEQVAVLASTDGNTKVWRAAVRVQFRTGGHRDYVVVAWARHGDKPAVWAAESAKWSSGGSVDLRKPTDAAKVEKALAQLSLPRPE